MTITIFLSIVTGHSWDHDFRGWRLLIYFAAPSSVKLSGNIQCLIFRLSWHLVDIHAVPGLCSLTETPTVLLLILVKTQSGG